VSHDTSKKPKDLEASAAAIAALLQQNALRQLYVTHSVIGNSLHAP